MRNTVAFVLAGTLSACACAQEVGWVEDFDGADNWYAVGYTHTPAKQYSFTVQDGIGHFHVEDVGKAMRWMTTVPGVNLKTYRNLEMRYRAVNQVDDQPAYFLYMQVNLKNKQPKDPPVRLEELTADGEWHVLRKEMPRKDEGAFWATKFVLAVHSRGGPADVWVDYIKLIAPEPEPLPAPESIPGPSIGTRHDLDDLSAWRSLDDVPYQGIDRMSCADGTGHFEVEGMFRNAIFEWRLDQPVDVGKFRHLVFKYRATGQRQVYTRYERTLRHFLTVGAGDKEEPVYGWNSLTKDGAWHIASNTFSAASFPDGVEYVRLNLSSEESSSATFDLDYIYFADARPSVRFDDLFRVVRGGKVPPGRDFRFVELDGFEGGDCAELLQRYAGIVDFPAAGSVSVDGVPFRLGANAAVLGVYDQAALTVPVAGEMRAVYALISSRLEGKDDFCSWGGSIRVIEEPERFVIRLDYGDGTAFESLPFNIQGGSFTMPPGLGLFGVINPHPERELASVSFADRTVACGFHVIAVTLQKTGEPLFEVPAPRHILPPPPRVTDKAPDEVTSIERTADTITLSSDYLTVEFDLAQGIRIARMFSGILAQDLRPEGELFALETEGAALSSDEVTVTGIEPISDAAIRVSFTAQRPVPLEGALTLAWHGASEIGLTVSLRNRFGEPLRGSLTLTPISRVSLDPQPEDIWLFYPGFGTLITNEAFYADTLQSDRLPLQLVAAWSPAKGGGLYLMGHDSTCAYDQHFILEKYDGAVSAATRYLYLDLAPEEEATLPEVAIGAYLGDYHQALAAYRDWIGTWYRPLAQHPDWFRRVCTFVGVTPTLAVFQDENGQMDLTPHAQAAAKRYGSCDYVHVFSWGASKEHGSQGDFTHYELLGGRESWRNALAGLHERGIGSGLYLDPILIDERSEIAQETGDRWKVLNAEGESTSWSQGNFYICAALEEVRQYWHDTYQRVAREFRPRGLYMDQIGYANPRDWACFNPAHGHKTPVGLRPAQAGLVRRIREGINSVDPSIANYSEFVPVDVLCQYQDGSFTHTIRYEWERPQSFLVNPIYLAIPEIKCFEIYSGSGNNVYSNSRLPMRLFWGGETLYLCGDLTDYSPATLAAIRTISDIWHRYPDAFATMEPEFLVETLKPGVFANRFPAEDYEVYVLFNDLPYTVEGPVIAIPGGTGKARYLEAWENVELRPGFMGPPLGGAQVSLTIPPKQVRCIVVERARG